MGCGPSKRSNTVHPVTSESSNCAERNRVTPQESMEAPPSTPVLIEPEEMPLLPGQPHNDDINCGSQQQHTLVGALQEALHGRQRHRLWRQLSITEDIDTFPTSSDATDFAVEQGTTAGCGVGGIIHSGSDGQGQDQRWLVGTRITVDPFARLPGHPLPPSSSCPHFHPGVPANSPLRLYGTDSQVEFFKMLDKKIDEGPDYSVSDSEDCG